MAATTSFDGEDRELQQAIQESLEVRASNMKTQFGDNEATSSAAEPGQYVYQRASIEDRIKDLALRAATELPLVDDPRADTLVFIDPPQKQPEQDQSDYEYYVKRYERPVPMRKEILINHSQLLTSAFSPTAQFRIVRRRNLVKQLADSPNIKYVLDLTPPTEGEEAVFLTTELCCSEGVRLWYQASEIWKVSKVLVGGEEEYTSVRLRKVVSRSVSLISCECSLLTVLQPEALSFAQEGRGWDDSNAEGPEATISDPARPPSPKLASTRMPLEYTPVRHRSAIERVLAALQGMDPLLDSAPKVWTTFAVAKYFGIKHSEMDSYIIRWLRAYPNSYFLEVLPEASLQIADGLENYDLARDTFAILVGEEALDNLCRARKPVGGDKQSAFGRKKEELPEAIKTRVEYASKNFLDRINDDFTNFVGNMQWIEDVAEFRRLSSYIQPELQDTVRALKVLLKDYVRGAIYKLLCVNYDSVPSADLPHQGGQDLLPRMNRSDVWISLSPNERLLTRTFWHALLSFRLFEGSTNLDIKTGWNMTWDNVKFSSVEQQELDRGTYREVKTEGLKRLIRTGNRWLSHDEPQISRKLPTRTRNDSRRAFAESGNPSVAPIEPVDPLYGAQILATEPGTGISQEINIASSFRPARQTFDVSPSSTPGNGLFSHVASTNWLFGSPRQDSMSNVTSDSEGVSDVTNLELGSAVNRGQTDQILSRWPAPEGFSSWSGQENSEEVDEPRKILNTQQQIQERSPTPPFFREDTTLPSSIQLFSEQENAVMSQPCRSQRGIDHLFPSQPSAKASAMFFDLELFFLEAKAYIWTLAKQKLQFSDEFAREEPHEIGITNTLVCLEDSEWKYLPLWAGGNDDGTGGVFIEHPPTADLGFSTPGPEVHTGDTPATSTKAPSEVDFEIVDGQATDSGTNTSMVNNRSSADFMRRNRVYAVDSADASSHGSGTISDNFTMVAEDDEVELARSQIEAQERTEAAEEEAAKEARRIEKGKERMIDENYADLFDDDEDDMDEDGDDTDRAEEEEDFLDDDDRDGDLVLV